MNYDANARLVEQVFTQTGSVWVNPYDPPDLQRSVKVLRKLPDGQVELLRVNSGAKFVAVDAWLRRTHVETFRCEMCESDAGGRSWRLEAPSTALPSFRLCEGCTDAAKAGDLRLVVIIDRSPGDGFPAATPTLTDDPVQWDNCRTLRYVDAWLLHLEQTRPPAKPAVSEINVDLLGWNDADGPPDVIVRRGVRYIRETTSPPCQGFSS